MRVLKISVAMASAMVLAATSAFAGGAHCASKASASASASCSAKQVAACTAGQMANCTVEATRLSSGDLAVHYVGTNPEAVAYLQAKCAGSPDKFCCPMTQKMASNEACKVEITKVSDGVLVLVTSPKKDVVDAYEKEFATLTTTATTATK